MEKSYVGLEHALCPICGDVFATGNILLDRRLNKVFDAKPITGYEICAECNQKITDGYIALIVADHGEDTTEIELGQINRTGEIIWARKDTMKNIFDMTVPHGNPPFVCISKGMTDYIKKMAAASNE